MHLAYTGIRSFTQAYTGLRRYTSMPEIMRLCGWALRRQENPCSSDVIEDIHAGGHLQRHDNFYLFL